MNKTDSPAKRVGPLFAIVVFPVVAFGGLILDLKTKDWAFGALGMPGEYRWHTQPELHGTHWIWTDVFGFQTSLNEGALFGLGQGYSVWFAALSFVALAGIVGWMAHSAWKNRVLTLTLAMITAGVLGNLYDRLGLHELCRDGSPLYAVRDWILVMIGSYHWPNFNVADSFLVCGTILLILITLFEKEPPSATSKQKIVPQGGATNDWPHAYDIGIVGAGPAGATLARLLANRYRVLLLDSGRPKCCGGILAPEAQNMLAKFGLALPKSVLVDPQPFAVSILDADNGRSGKYARQYINIDRMAFDQWTLSLVPPSVDIRREALYRFTEQQDKEWIVHFTEGPKERTERVRRLVGADGAHSAVRREFFPQCRLPQRYLAIQDWFAPDAVRIESDTDFRNTYVGIFDREFTDFYCWAIPKDDLLIVGGAFPSGPEIRGRFEGFKKKLEKYGLFLGEGTRREAGMILRPISLSSICLGNERVLLVGEAAGLISPSSAEGISAALTAAAALDAALDEKNVAKKYRRNLRGLIGSLGRKNLKSPAMFTPWLRNWVMKSGVLSLE